MSKFKTATEFLKSEYVGSQKDQQMTCQHNIYS